MLNVGACGTIEELAKSERVNRGLHEPDSWLTLLAPEIVEAILDGRHPPEMGLDGLLKGFPLEWDGQYKWLGNNDRRRQE